MWSFIFAILSAYEPLKPYTVKVKVSIEPLKEYPSTKDIEIPNWRSTITTLDPVTPLKRLPDYDPIENLTPVDYKLIQFQIFKHKKNLELAYALGLDLYQSHTDQKSKSPILHDLLDLALSLGLLSDAKYWAKEILKETPNDEAFYKGTQALTPLDKDFFQFLSAREPKNPEWDKASIHYILARSHQLWDQNQYQKAINILNAVTTPETLLLKSVWLYRLGQVHEALTTLKQIGELKESSTNRIKMLHLLNQGRILFQLGNFHEAIQAYNAIPQTESEWITAMIEKSWINLIQGEFGKVVGNTLALEMALSDKMVIPEIYFLQALGYFGICQWPNAIESSMKFSKSIQILTQNVFEPILKLPPEGLFDHIRNIVMNSKDPLRLWVKYLTLTPEFYLASQQWNYLQKQHESMNHYVLTIINQEKKLLDEKRQLIKSKNFSENSLIDIKLYIWKKARFQIKNQRERFLTDKKTIEQHMRKQFANITYTKIAELTKKLQYLADQNELLQIDVYNLANQSLRGKMIEMGFDHKNKKLRIPSSNDLTWKFMGEIWKDEIGYFEANLKNHCQTFNGGQP